MNAARHSGPIDLIVRPAWFFSELRQPPYPWKMPLALYAVSLAAGSLFYSLKPEGFPQGSPAAEIEPHSFWFWLGVGFAGVLLSGAISAAIPAILRFIAASTSVRTAQIFLVICASHIFYLLLFICLSLAVWLRHDSLYKTGELFFSLAALVFTVRGVRAVAHVSIPRAFLAVFLASFMMLGVMALLFAAGVLPSSFFKALLLM